MGNFFQLMVIFPRAKMNQMIVKANVEDVHREDIAEKRKRLKTLHAWSNTKKRLEDVDRITSTGIEPASKQKITIERKPKTQPTLVRYSFCLLKIHRDNCQITSKLEIKWLFYLLQRVQFHIHCVRNLYVIVRVHVRKVQNYIVY